MNQAPMPHNMTMGMPIPMPVATGLPMPMAVSAGMPMPMAPNAYTNEHLKLPPPYNKKPVFAIKTLFLF
jgi:hypothetical protein